MQRGDYLVGVTVSPKYTEMISSELTGQCDHCHNAGNWFVPFFFSQTAVLHLRTFENRYLHFEIFSNAFSIVKF